MIEITLRLLYRHWLAVALIFAYVVLSFTEYLPDPRAAILRGEIVTFEKQIEDREAALAVVISNSDAAVDRARKSIDEAEEAKKALKKLEEYSHVEPATPDETSNRLCSKYGRCFTPINCSRDCPGG